MADSSNFAFLKEHDPGFFQLASAAEAVFVSDPNTTLIKLRQLGEALAQDLAGRAGIERENLQNQADLLYRLSREIQLDGNIRNLFHAPRVEGNKATHQFRTQHREALDGLKVARSPRRSVANWCPKTPTTNPPANCWRALRRSAPPRPRPSAVGGPQRRTKRIF